MNKTFQFLVAGGLLAFSSVGIAAGGSRCEAFTGTLKIVPTNCAAFKQIRHVERIFEDTEFLYETDPNAPYLCFAGALTGNLGTLPITATTLSALTKNQFVYTDPASPYPGFPYVPAPAPEATPPIPPLVQLLTAASVVSVTSNEIGKKPRELGSLFFRDNGVTFVVPHPASQSLPWQPYSYEQLIAVSGTKKFAGSSASLQIQGFEFPTLVPPLLTPDLSLPQTLPATVVGTVCP